MKKLLHCLLLLLFLNPGLGAQTVYKDYIDGRIYVKLTQDAIKKLAGDDPKNIPLARFAPHNKLLASYGVTRVHKPFYQAWDDETLPRILKLEFANISQVENLITAMRQVPGVEYAEKVPLMKTDATPNDPLYSSAAHLTQINAAAAWNVFNSTASGSSSITVAIVDNAIMWTHADLVANTYTNTGEIANNGTDDDGNGYIDDVNGYDVTDGDNNTIPTALGMMHGTHCAGIAGARTDNNIGVASIGWNIKIIPVKCQTDNGNFIDVLNGYDGIVYAVKAKARIISCSWSNSTFALTEQAVIDYAWNRGSIIMAAAGNNNNNLPSYPGAYTNVYCVAAVTNSDQKLSISSYGATWVDICAPGDVINSTIPYVTTPAYQQLSGTSMATPMVAGLAALMLSKSPYMTRNDVLNCISSTAANIYTLSANSAYTQGNQLGAGRIDAFAAMTCAATYTAPAPVANFYAFPLQTCPNTSVSLYDSSVYAPTSWNWVFQGGTPATSTLANPVVQWSLSGTYSVSLTVSNASGSSTATKLSYITVSGPQSLPLSQGFESPQFLPSGWSPNNLWNDALYWERAFGVGGFGTSTACAMFDNYTYYVVNERDEMRTPKFSFSNVATARLRFDVAYARYDNVSSDSLQVKISTNCGSTWTSIYLKGGTSLATAPNTTVMFSPTSTQWRRDTIDISSYVAGQGNVMFSFVNRGHYGQVLYVDNINIVTPSPTVSIGSPTSVCSGAGGALSSSLTGAAGYTWSLPGSSTPTSSIANPTVTYPSGGTYTVILTANNGSTLTSTSQTINVIATPTITASSLTLCSGGSSILFANGASSYSWNAVAGSSSFAVNNATASTVYTISGDNLGCVSSGTTQVTVINNPTVTAQSQTICPGGTATLIASGATTYLWDTGATSSSIIVTPSVSMAYWVTGTSNGCSHTRTLSLTLGSGLSLFLNSNPGAVCVAGSATISATGANTYTWSNSANGSSIVVSPSVSTVYTVVGFSGACSGTAAINVTITPTPTLFVLASPNGILCTGSSATLTAYGASTYSWSTGATSNPLVVTPTANSIYTVTGTTSGCSGTGTVALTTGASSLNINLSANVFSICSGSQATVTASGANTYTWNTGATSSFIVVTPTASTVYSVNGSNGSCSGNSAILISVIPGPVSVISSTNSGCNSSCTGIVTASTSGGTGPYTYSLSGNSCTTVPCVNICPGLYTLYTSDASGCKSFNIFSVSASSGNILASISTSNASCASCADGALTAVPGGGTGPYSYTWSPSGGNAATASGLLPMCYTLTMVDAVNCSHIAQACVGIGTGVEDLNMTGPSLLVHPNPAHDFATISCPGATFNLRLVNALGQEILTRKNVHHAMELNTTELAKGVYFVEASVEGTLRMKKLVVE